jgi:hypothetical protein
MASDLRARRTPDWAIVVSVVGLLALSNVMTNRVLPSWAYVPWSLGMAVVLPPWLNRRLTARKSS